MTITFLSVAVNSLFALYFFWAHHDFTFQAFLTAWNLIPAWLGITYIGIGLFQIFLRFGASVKIIQHRSLASTSPTQLAGLPMHVALDKVGPPLVAGLGHPGAFPGEPIHDLNKASFFIGIAAAVLSFIQVHKPNLREIQNERVAVEKIVARWPKAVVVFGSARLKDLSEGGSPMAAAVVEQARELGAALWEEELVPRTGAGPSIMQAVIQGYRAAARMAGVKITPNREPQGVRIEKLPFEQFTTKEIRPDYLHRTIHFVTRKLGLHTNTYGAIAVAGGYGTNDEDFEVLRRRMPLVLLDPPSGPSYWEPMLARLKAFWEVEGLTAQAQPLPIVTRNPREAVRYIKEQSAIRKGTPSLNARAANRELEEGFKIMDRWSKPWVAGPDGQHPMTVTLIGRPGPASLERARRLTTKLLTYPNVTIRVGTRGPLFDAVDAVARKQNQLQRLEAVLFIPVGQEPTEQERRVPKLVYTHDESNHQVEITKGTNALVVLPGRAGTLNKLFDLLQLNQTDKITHAPTIILLSAKHTWKRFIEKVAEQAYHPFGRNDPTHLINEEDQYLWNLAATELQALGFLGLNGSHPTKKGALSRRGKKLAQDA